MMAMVCCCIPTSVAGGVALSLIQIFTSPIIMVCVSTWYRVAILVISNEFDCVFSVVTTVCCFYY